MSSASIPVDLHNPGQVLACLGILETAAALGGQVSGGFAWEGAGRAKFVANSKTGPDPVLIAHEFLDRAEVLSLAPAGSDLSTERWDIPTRNLEPADDFPIGVPSSPASLPAVLLRGEHGEVRLDYWGDSTRRDNTKFWAGSGGYPGAGLLRDALQSVRRLPPWDREDPFSLGAAQSSSFRLDWRRDYIPLQTGFSLNKHPNLQPRGYPLVEVLAAVGLSHARPKRVQPTDKLHYRYAVLGGRELPLPLLRAGLGGAPLPFPTRHFDMQLDWPGKEGQARSITQVTEVHLKQ